MKTKNLFLIGCIGLALMIPEKMLSQTQTTTGSIKIITPISLAKDVDMDFGVMSKGATGGTCVLSTLGGRTATGTVNLSSGTPAAAAASFTVTGNAGSTYAITLPATFDVVDGLNNMTVSALTARAAGAADDGTTGTIGAGTGTQIFKVGGTITIATDQAGGEYTGNFDVSVNYN